MAASEPSAGHIIFFDWEGDGVTDHVGIVERVENGDGLYRGRKLQ